MTIRFTSSSKCGPEEETTGVPLCVNDGLKDHEHQDFQETKKSEEGEEKEKIYMKINWWSKRNCVNKLMYCLYRMYRVLYVTCYYYFFPFFVLFGSFLLPYLASKGLLGKKYYLYSHPDLKLTQ